MFIPMYHRFTYVILLTLIFHGACIIIAPSRTTHDQYLSDFETQSGKFSTVFLEVDYSDLVEMQFSHIYLFATWCPHCILKFREIKKGNKPSEKTIYISTNYNLESIEKIVKNAIDTIYIISNEFYGSIEQEKIRVFTTELLGYENTVTGLPQEFTRISDQEFIRRNNDNMEQ